MKLSRRIITFLLILALLVSVSTIQVSAAGNIMYGIGFTTGSNLRLRSQPSTSSAVVDVAPKNEVVVVINQTGDWYHVIYNLQEGYMHKDYVSVLTRENAELGYGKVNGSSVNLRTAPSTSGRSLGMAGKGERVYIIGLNTGWYKVIWKSHVCYIRSDFVDLTEIPYENRDSANSPKFFRGGKSTGVAPSASALNGTTATPETTVKPETGNASSALGQKLVSGAQKYLGVPYVYGGASPSGFDCSGLVYYLLKNEGYSPYRTAADQYKMGTYVAKEDLQPGDLVFFQNTAGYGISHVGIYVGDGKFIHAPRTGSVVSYADLNSTYYTNHYYGARRVG